MSSRTPRQPDPASVTETETETEDDCAICGPALALDSTRTLTLRHLVPTDEQGLRDLYERLSPYDLQRRFFTGGVPPESFLHRWSSLAEIDGFGLVAELAEDGKVRLVGEAGYSPLDNGDAELGIAVDPSHRGWLGPWMLDSLLAHAKQDGVANLQALILADNRAMLALAKKRGYAVLGHPEWGKIRVTMSTSGHQPSWPRTGDKPRVLIETNRLRWAGEDALRQAGFDVALCVDANDVRPHCPVLEGEACPLVDGADAVVIDLPDDDAGASLAAAEQALHPGTRVILCTNREGDGARTSAAEVLGLLDDLSDQARPQ